MSTSSSDYSDDDYNYGKVTAVQTKFTWVTDDLVNRLKLSKHDGIESPSFNSQIDGTNQEWFLFLMTENRNISISLNAKCTKLNASVDFVILNANNDEIYKKDNIILNFSKKTFPRIDRVPLEKFVNKKDTSLKSKKLTLIFTFTSKQYAEIEKIKSSKDLKITKASKQLSRLDCLNTYTKLVNNKQFSDIVFIVEGKELYAYKGILASRSPVFMAMFTHNMTESNQNRVEINDISWDTMHNLLQYIYTDLEPQFKSDEIKDKCKSLLIAADKYGLEKLKVLLEEKLRSDIQVGNVFEYLNFADSYNAVQLKKAAIEFIMSHSDEIAGSDNYKKFIDLHPDVSCEVFRSLLTNKRRRLE